MPQTALVLHWKGKEQEQLYAKQESEKPEGLNRDCNYQERLTEIRIPGVFLHKKNYLSSIVNHVTLCAAWHKAQ